MLTLSQAMYVLKLAAEPEGVHPKIKEATQVLADYFAKKEQERRENAARPHIRSPKRDSGVMTNYRNEELMKSVLARAMPPEDE